MQSVCWNQDNFCKLLPTDASQLVRQWPWYSDSQTRIQTILEAHPSPSRMQLLTRRLEARGGSCGALTTPKSCGALTTPSQLEVGKLSGTLSVTVGLGPRLSLTRSASTLRLSLRRGLSLADQVNTCLDQLHSHVTLPDLVIKKEALSSAQDFQPESCVAKKNIEIKIFQILYRLVCTAQSA